MSFNTPYASLSLIPHGIPLFPLYGTILLPHSELPLNIFEPRYIEMVDTALAGDRLIGIIQPKIDPDEGGLSKDLFPVGCVGRITAFQETGDGRYLITLTGVARFRFLSQLPVKTPYVQASVEYLFEEDLREDDGIIAEKSFIDPLKLFLKRMNYETDWQNLSKASLSSLVNAFSLFLPFKPQEKQGLLEAVTVQERAALMQALIEMTLVEDFSGDSSGTLQ